MKEEAIDALEQVRDELRLARDRPQAAPDAGACRSAAREAETSSVPRERSSSRRSRCVGIALVAPGRLELAVRIYALVLCAAVIVVLLLALRRAYPDETRAARAGDASPATSAPAEPRTHRARDRSRDRRLVRSALPPRSTPARARSRAARARGEASRSRSTPEAARAILGEDAWELVRPDRPAPEDRLAKGIPPRELAQVVDALEGI